MTEYKDEVELQRRKLILESWGKQWSNIYMEGGHTFVQYNDGSVTIDNVEMSPPNTLEKQWRDYEREEYGNTIKVSN